MPTFAPNEEQKLAIGYPVDKPLKILAGAGTGKTSVLVEKYVYLVKELGFQPSEILALTFTVKAAAQMKDRIARRIGLQARSPDAWISTFHSFCYSVLKENAFAAGLDSNFELADESTKRTIQKEIRDSLYARKLELDPLSLKNLDLDKLDGILDDAFRAIEVAKNRMMGPEEFGGYCVRKLGELGEEFPDNEAMAVESECVELISFLYAKYQERLSKENLVDFDDLIMMTYGLLLERSDVSDYYRKRFRYILVDEFQDTDESQFKLLELVAEPGFSNVVVVGDDKQSIYSFRNAEVGNIRRFPGEAISLQQNYRSYNEILEMANYSICLDPYFGNQREAVVLRNDIKGYSGGKVVTFFHTNDRSEEAEFIASEVLSLIGEGMAPSDIAVLFRTKSYVKTYEDKLKEKGIPYEALGGGFYDREEVKDIIAYLELINSPFNRRALVRVLSNPPIGLSKASLVEIFGLIEEDEKVDVHGLSAIAESTVEIPEFARSKLRDLSEFLRKMEEALGKGGLANFLLKVMEESKYMKWVLSESPGTRARRYANLRKLYQIALNFERVNSPASLDQFIEHLKFIAADVEESEASPSGNAVQLMTVHRAKGLEFKIVFLSDIDDSEFRKEGHYVFDPDGIDEDGNPIEGFGLVFNDYTPGKDLPKFSAMLEKNRSKERHGSEERRISYVAVTRAMDRLYLTTSRYRGAESSLPLFYREVLFKFRKENFIEVATGWVSEPERAKTVAAVDTPGVRLRRDFRERLGDAISRIKFAPESTGKGRSEGTVYLTFSRIKAFIDCPLRYKFFYLYTAPRISPGIMAAQEEVVDDAAEIWRGPPPYDPIILGVIVHKTLQECYRDSDRDLEDIFRWLVLNEGITEEDYRSVYRGIGRKIFRNFNSGGYLNIKPIFMEKEFNLRFSGDGSLDIHLKGFVDRIDVSSSGRWRIVEYKTNQRVTPEEEEIYRLQLRLYALAAEEGIFGREVIDPELRLFFLRQGRDEEVSWGGEMLGKTRELVLDIGNHINSGNFSFDSIYGQHRDCANCAFGSKFGFCPGNMSAGSDADQCEEGLHVQA